MSGDWIKMRKDLHTHPKVVRISSALQADRLRVVGALHAVWGVFDSHSIDGLLPGYSMDTMDALIAWQGFSRAMAGVEWLESDGDCGLKMPRFSEHNGASAKRRAQDSERKRASRNSPQSVLDLSASDADEMRTREEKRREEHNPPYPQGFARFWLAWPSTDRKTAKPKCAEVWRRRSLETQADRIIAHVEALKGTKSWSEGYEPAPLTYLNQRRYEDDAPQGDAGAMAGVV